MRSTSASRGLALAAALIGVAHAVCAQEEDVGPAFLEICNKGSVAAAAVTAYEDDWSYFPGGYELDVEAWVALAPGECKYAYNSPSLAELPNPAYLAFVKVDADGTFTPLQPRGVPDIGPWTYTSLYANLRWRDGKGPALTSVSKRLCVKSDATSYKVGEKGDPACPWFHPNGDAAQYFELEAGLFFHPSAHRCVAQFGNETCWGGEYYLAIAPRAEDSDLRASAGDTPSGDRVRTTSAAEDVLANTQSLLEGLAYVALIAAGVNAVAGSDEPERPRDALQEYNERMRRERPDLFAPPPAAGPQSVAGYSKNWVGQEARTFGTISRVDRFNNHIILEFAESPNGLVACVNSSAFLALGVRNDNELVGKVVDLHGTVAATPYYCRGGESTIEPLRYGDLEVRTQ